MALLNIGTGISDFREMVTDNRYYIDKTKFIEEFFNMPVAKTTLITRPRRFGKTLTMSMLREFFDIKNKEKENIFEGLAISKNQELCRKWQNQYPVVFITLKDCDGTDFNLVLGQFALAMRNLSQQFSYLFKSKAISDSDKKYFQKVIGLKADQTMLEGTLSLLCKALYEYHGKKVILLIDEYDVPVNQSYNTEYYADVIKFLRILLGSVLKDAQYIQFAVLTGCLRITKESIFTGLNHFECYGISDNSFSSTFGFTAKEVDTILADAGLEDKKPIFKEWYDGYTFGKQKEIYCPWDVISYVKALQQDNDAAPIMYWNNTSGNSIIKDFLKRTDFDVAEKLESLTAGGCIDVPLSDQQTYDLLHSSENNFWNILYLTGYLTKANEEQIQRCGKTAVKGNCLLTIPNKEVMVIYETEIKEWISDNINSKDKQAFFNAFWSGDTKKVEEILTHQLKLSISFNDYAEKFYHAVLLGIFLFTNNRVESNLEGGEGRADLYIKNKKDDIAAVIEVKYTKIFEEMPKLCEEALHQIEDKEYDYKLRIDYDTIFHWGIAFYKKRCYVRVIKKEHCLRRI